MTMHKTGWRRVVFVAAIGLFAALVFSRFVQLAAAPKKNYDSLDISQGERGKILDRNGRVLAMDIPKFNVSIWRPDTDPEAFPGEIGELAGILGMEAGQIRSKYESGKQNYFYIARRMSGDQVQPLFEAKKNGKYKGVVVQEVPGRLYPEGDLASKLLGFAGEGNRGLEGIEYKYDGELSPKPRKAEALDGHSLASSQKAPRGDTVSLTIDADLQFMLERIAKDARAKNDAESVFILAMDVHTGEILAYVAEPGYDLNDYGAYSAEARRDPLTLYAYEPGSVFKVFSMSSILDSGGITPSTRFDCDGAYRKTLANGEKIVIKDLGVYGKQDLAGVLARSSNAGVGYASDTIEEKEFHDRLVSFGFGSKTGIGPAGESSGSLRDPSKWSARSKPTIAIGQEVMVTAVQMITAGAAVANGGLLLKPVTVRGIKSADGETLYAHEPVVVRRVISEKTAASMLLAMESAASMEGTGWRAKVPDVRMAVKTGTAQMIDTRTRAYSDKDFVASTMGILPADSPRLALYVVIVKPKGASYLGGQIAAPILRDAAEAALSRVDISREKTPTVSHDSSVELRGEAEAAIGATMPDLTGYPKSALLPLLRRTDIIVNIEGDGYVASQAPEPGAPVAAGARITLRLQ